MTNRFYPVLSSGSSVIPTTNGTYQTADQSTCDANNCAVYAEFFSDPAGTLPVTPTAGTVLVQSSPLGNNFLTPTTNGTITATTCTTPNSTYVPPAIAGRIATGQVTLAGITGAAYARIVFWRYA